MSDAPEPQVPEGAAVLPLIPSELGADPLLLAVLHAVVFLDGSDDRVVNPQAATEALEYLAGYLQRLEGPQRRKVLEDLEALAAFGRQEGWARPAVRFLKEFPAEYGFGEEETT
jgi:hypothetical protein